MSCPLCDKEYSFFNPSSDVYWSIPGGGQAVCKKCKKHRMKEIDKHNEPYHRNAGDKKKDLNCKHQWMHPAFNMWFCSKCNAVYRFMCGCGGSEYVCGAHHLSHQEMMIKEEGSSEKYLNKHSW